MQCRKGLYNKFLFSSLLRLNCSSNRSSLVIMSGIEAAGLILAAFPLLISALEHYRESAGALENWWEIKREYRKCKREIEHQKLRFEGALEEFLLPLIVDDEALKALIEDPGGMLWKNPRLEEALQERLPKSYDLYLETVQEINDVMNGLKRELGLDKVHFQKELEVEAVCINFRRASLVHRLTGTIDALQADKSDSNSRSKQNKTARKANLEFQTQRIRFALGESSRNKLFNELAHYNQRLRDLLETHDRLTALRSTGEKRRTEISCRVLSQFWRHASTLYTLLARAWCCECETSHHANLLLQHRTTSAAEFKILFLSSKAASNPGPGAWKCQETHFKLLTDETPSSEIASPTSASLQTALTKAPNKKSNKANFFRSSLMGQREKPSNVE